MSHRIQPYPFVFWMRRGYTTGYKRYTRGIPLDTRVGAFGTGYSHLTTPSVEGLKYFLTTPAYTHCWGDFTVAVIKLKLSRYTDDVRVGFVSHTAHTLNTDPTHLDAQGSGYSLTC